MAVICIVGAGNMGTAVGYQLAKSGHTLHFFSVEEDVVEDINTNRKNTKYVGDIALPESCSATGDFAEAMRGAEFVVLAVPSHIIPNVLGSVIGNLTPEQIIVNLAKGLHRETLKPVGAMIEDLLPDSHKSRLVSMSGPSIANEILHDVPTTFVIAAKDGAVLERTQEVFANDVFRIYINHDKAGVDLGGFLKNIVAIMAGACDGLGLGMNVKSAIMTRGFHEISLIAEAQGASPKTLTGLSCLGDLIVTCMSEHSRNRRFGEALARGTSADDARQAIGQAVEGVIATELAMKFAREKGLRLVLIPQIYAMVHEGKDPRRAIDDFFRGDGTREF